jgi:hypothetical protein
LGAEGIEFSHLFPRFPGISHLFPLKFFCAKRSLEPVWEMEWWSFGVLGSKAPGGGACGWRTRIFAGKSAGCCAKVREVSRKFAQIRAVVTRCYALLRVRACLKTMKAAVFFENPPGGGSFARGRRWLGRYSPLRGCSDLAALATAKIPRPSTLPSFQAGSRPFFPRRPRNEENRNGRGSVSACQARGLG